MAVRLGPGARIDGNLGPVNFRLDGCNSARNLGTNRGRKFRALAREVRLYAADLVARARPCGRPSLPVAATGGGTAGRIQHARLGVLNHPPAEIKELIISSYNDALTPIFIWMVPLAVIAAVVLVFIREKPLATAIEHDVLSESIRQHPHYR
jgi:hypothetical protein